MQHLYQCRWWGISWKGPYRVVCFGMWGIFRVEIYLSGKENIEIFFVMNAFEEASFKPHIPRKPEWRTGSFSSAEAKKLQQNQQNKREGILSISWIFLVLSFQTTNPQRWVQQKYHTSVWLSCVKSFEEMTCLVIRSTFFGLNAASSVCFFFSERILKRHNAIPFTITFSERKKRKSLCRVCCLVWKRNSFVRSSLLWTQQNKFE